MYQPSDRLRVYRNQFCVCELKLVYNAKYLAHTLIKAPENYRLMLMITLMPENFFTEDISHIRAPGSKNCTIPPFLNVCPNTEQVTFALAFCRLMTDYK